jgi:hypothetical protein
VPFWRSVVLTSVPLVAVLLVGKPEVYSHLGRKGQEVLRDIRVARLNARDDELLTRGYYEELTVSPANGQLWELYMKRPDHWPRLRETGAERVTGDFLQHELKPFVSMIFRGAPFSTNRWGLRDREYEQQKPADTYRIALLGGSVELGHGVSDDQTFENLVEDRLNQATTGKVRHEILNFAVGGYTPLQQLFLVEHKVLDFTPDAVFYTGHLREVRDSLQHISVVLRGGTEIPYAYLQEIVRKAGVHGRMSGTEANRQLKPYGNKILAWIYGRMVEACRSRGVVPVYIYVPILERVGRGESAVAVRFMTLAKEAGFVVLDLSDVYRNQRVAALRVAEWDLHPNVSGHRLLAARLYRALRENSKSIPLGLLAQAGDH